jgi:hypothetical protein
VIYKYLFKFKDLTLEKKPHLVIICLNLFLEAVSRYPMQSFAPNNGTKGFPFLSGLGQLW